MPDIASATNTRVKTIKRLISDRRFRHREQQFMVEGTRWMDEISRSNAPVQYWLASEDWLLQNHKLSEVLTAQIGRPLTIEPAILKNLADTESPSGVLAILSMPSIDWPSNPTFLLLLDQIRDPGNLGTLIRSALAAGVEGLLLGPGCVDPFNPKVVRSTMGALLRLPIQQIKWEDGAEFWGDCTVYLADATGSTEYTQINWTNRSAIMIGGEANGASEAAKEIINTTISIPMAQTSESLNAGIAGSIILFEALRQKRL